ncbi:MAG: DsbA family protein [Terriglobia bacterium]
MPRIKYAKPGCLLPAVRRKSGCRVLLCSALAALTVMIAPAGLSGAPQPALRTPPAGTQCNTTAVRNPTAEAAARPLTAAQGAAILRELRAIHLLLKNGAAARAGARRSLAPQDVKMRIEPGWHVLGSAHAPVTIVEFADLQCPFCRRFQTATFTEIKKDYIDTGKVRFIARDLPLPMHAYALGAAEAARCAGDQGAFWQFRDAVLGDQAAPAPDILLKHASELRLNLHEFQACLSRGKYKSLVQTDHEDATALGIHGVPAFVIGRASGGWIKGVSMVGARSFPYFQQEIGMALNGSPSSTAKTHRFESANPTQGPGRMGKAGSR